MARSTNKLTIVTNLPDKPRVARGGGAWPLVLDHVEYWAWSNGVFSNSELDSIINIGLAGELEKAATFGPVQSDKNRNSFVHFIYPNEITEWVFARLAGAISDMNNRYFQFDLTGMEQGLQFTRYEAPGQHYDWHVDRGFMTATRKLSLTIQLSDPSDYKGGDLQLMFGKKPVTVPKERGMVTAFPSYAVHRVKPVTAGTRYSLVAWVSGPPFK